MTQAPNSTHKPTPSFISMVYKRNKNTILIGGYFGADYIYLLP